MNTYDFYWWITALIVGVVSNIITNYLIKKYSDVIAKYSQKYRERRNKKLKQRNELIDLLVINDFYMNHYYHKEIRYYIRGIVMSICALFFISGILYLRSISDHSPSFVIVFILNLILAFSISYMANYSFRKAIELSDLLDEAFKRKKNITMPSA